MVQGPVYGAARVVVEVMETTEITASSFLMTFPL